MGMVDHRLSWRVSHIELNIARFSVKLACCYFFFNTTWQCNKNTHWQACYAWGFHISQDVLLRVWYLRVLIILFLFLTPLIPKKEFVSSEKRTVCRIYMSNCVLWGKALVMWVLGIQLTHSVIVCAIFMRFLTPHVDESLVYWCLT